MGLILFVDWGGAVKVGQRLYTLLPTSSNEDAADLTGDALTERITRSSFTFRRRPVRVDRNRVNWGKTGSFCVLKERQCETFDPSTSHRCVINQKNLMAMNSKYPIVPADSAALPAIADLGWHYFVEKKNRKEYNKIGPSKKKRDGSICSCGFITRETAFLVSSAQASLRRQFVFRALAFDHAQSTLALAGLRRSHCQSLHRR